MCVCRCDNLQAKALRSRRKDDAQTSASHEFNHTDSLGHNTHLSYEVILLDCGLIAWQLNISIASFTVQAELRPDVVFLSKETGWSLIQVNNNQLIYFWR